MLRIILIFLLITGSCIFSIVKCNDIINNPLKNKEQKNIAYNMRWIPICILFILYVLIPIRFYFYSKSLKNKVIPSESV
jgi:hypothetical protein